ncbi:MAG: toll/interleukin-1 receptor domain-containing protein [Acidobacteriota bacterium]
MERPRVAPRDKMVLIYSHKNRNFLKPSSKGTKFFDFLEGLIKDEKLDFWWDEKMSHTKWDEEIRQHLYEADIVVCVVSQPFLTSDYVRKVESRITRKRQREDDIIVVPILLEPCPWQNYKWLRDYHHIPEQPIQPYYNHKRLVIYLEIIDHIRNRIRARREGKKQLKSVKPYGEPRMLSALRRVSKKDLPKEQLPGLVKQAEERARQFVKDPGLRKRICAAAKRKLEENGVESLKIRQLKDLDREFLMALDSRERPDPKKIRWVLRACGLHPQGKL